MLKLLHPFMPFITEEIWSFIPDGETAADNPENFIMKSDWPIFNYNFKFERDVEIIEASKSAIVNIRNIRAEAEALPSKKLSAIILSDKDKTDLIKAGEAYIKNIGNITEINFINNREEIPEEVMSAVMNGAEIFIPLDDLADYSAEFERLKKENIRLTGEVKRIEGKLSNRGFVEKAPEKVIKGEKDKQIGRAHV